MPLESYEVGRLPVTAVTFIATILENLFKGAGIGGGEEERAHGLIECVACSVRSGAAAHDVQRYGMGHVLISLFPDADCRLQVHAASLAG
ncbi:MAG TPA: hypothetical protein VH988_17185 [Thermoanaerobaculia bacterium]|nr:hypothetical protein [Thermoanaerobaculia bacterium]